MFNAAIIRESYLDLHLERRASSNLHFHSLFDLPACVYLFFPETKGRSLEELDIIFANAYHEGTRIVKEANEMPSLSGQELDAELARLFPDASAPQAVMRNRITGENYASGQGEVERKA